MCEVSNWAHTVKCQGYARSKGTQRLPTWRDYIVINYRASSEVFSKRLQVEQYALLLRQASGHLDRSKFHYSLYGTNLAQTTCFDATQNNIFQILYNFFDDRLTEKARSAMAKKAPSWIGLVYKNTITIALALLEKQLEAGTDIAKRKRASTIMHIIRPRGGQNIKTLTLRTH